MIAGQDFAPAMKNASDHGLQPIWFGGRRKQRVAGRAQFLHDAAPDHVFLATLQPATANCTLHVPVLTMRDMKIHEEEHSQRAGETLSLGLGGPAAPG